MKQAWKTKVSFDAARLGIDSVFLVALENEFLFGGPGPHPHGRVFDGHRIVKGGRTGSGPALDHVQILARSLEIGLWTEIRHVDHERIALPVSARVPKPLANTGRQMRTPIHDDIALPPLALT